MRKQTIRTALAAVAVIAGTAGPAPARASSACAELGGEVDSNQICHVHTAGDGYTVTFTFPVDYPDQQTLTTFLTQRRQDFIGYARDDFPRGGPYELDAKADGYHSSGTTSLVFNQYSDSGGAHPSRLYAAFNYDLGRDGPVTFDTLFKPGTNPVELLDVIVGRELQKRSGSPLPPNTIGATMYRNFAITEDALIFFLDQGQWLSQVDGPQEVSVLRSELDALLA